mgnify:CR=1 FL=1
MTAATIPGAEPFSHNGTGQAGVLVLHGFTGNPGSMRALAEACASADFHVELPQLAGHGTAMEDMIPTRWADWSGDVEKAYQRLAQRASKIVVMGLSMGGAAVLGVLAASASYIAAPAAVRLALPEANPGIYLAASLGITFPFNLTIGIPLIVLVAQSLEGMVG